MYFFSSFSENKSPDYFLSDIGIEFYTNIQEEKMSVTKASSLSNEHRLIHFYCINYVSIQSYKTLSRLFHDFYQYRENELSFSSNGEPEEDAQLSINKENLKHFLSTHLKEADQDQKNFASFLVEKSSKDLLLAAIHSAEKSMPSKGFPSFTPKEENKIIKEALAHQGALFGLCRTLDVGRIAIKNGVQSLVF